MEDRNALAFEGHLLLRQSGEKGQKGHLVAKDFGGKPWKTLFFQWIMMIYSKCHLGGMHGIAWYSPFFRQPHISHDILLVVIPVYPSIILHPITFHSITSWIYHIKICVRKNTSYKDI